MLHIWYLFSGSFHWQGHLSNMTSLIKCPFYHFPVHGILEYWHRKPASAGISHVLACWGHRQLNCLYWCKSKVARRSGLCAEMLSITCVRSCLVSKRCGCLQQLDSWFKHIQHGLGCTRVNLLRSEVFVKVNVIGQMFL